MRGQAMGRPLGRVVVGAGSAVILAATMLGAGAVAQSGQVEVFTYWTAGGEADGLAAIEEVFAQQHPGIEVINAGGVTIRHIVLGAEHENSPVLG